MPRGVKLALFAGTVVLSALTACSEERAERAGQSVGGASAKAGVAVEGFTAKAGQTVGTATDRAGRFFERAGERIQGKAPP